MEAFELVLYLDPHTKCNISRCFSSPILLHYKEKKKPFKTVVYTDNSYGCS